MLFSFYACVFSPYTAPLDWHLTTSCLKEGSSVTAVPALCPTFPGPFALPELPEQTPLIAL